MKYKICHHCLRKLPETEKCNCKKPTTKKELTDKRMGSYRWRMLSKRIIDRDVYCQRCLYKFNKITTKRDDRLSAHHILPRSKYPDDEHFWDENNLLCLCMTCNRQLSDTKPLDFEMPERVEREYHL